MMKQAKKKIRQIYTVVLCAGMFLVFGAQISIKMALRLLNRNKH
jgi:hypothetical protein